MIRERLIALFLLGVVMVLPPVLQVFNQPVRVLGVPVLYLYLFAAWAVLILWTAAVARGIGCEDDVPGPAGGADARNDPGPVDR